MRPAWPGHSRIVLTLPGVLMLLTALSVCFALVAVDLLLAIAAITLILPSSVYTVIQVSRATISGVHVTLSPLTLFFLHSCLAFGVVYFAAFMALVLAISFSLFLVALSPAWIVLCLPASAYLVYATARRAAEEFWPEPLAERSGKPKSPIPIPRRSSFTPRAATCGPSANSPQ